MPDDTFAQLAALKEDEASFRAAIRKELGAEIAEKTQDLTAEEILALLTAAAAATGAGAFFGKTGKSRATEEIGRLQTRLADIETKRARTTKPKK